MTDAQKAEGAGSVWNVNSWHWEHKNYTEVAKQLLTDKLLGLKLQEGDLKITTDKVKKITGEAQINIRKGKQIHCYEFNIEVAWLAETDSDEVEGSYQIHDFNESDLDFEVIDVTSKEDNEIAAKAKKLIKKSLKSELLEILKTFSVELSQFESNPKKLEEDRLKREKAMQETLKARKEKGEEKERLLQEQKEKEKKMKEEFSKWKQNNEDKKLETGAEEKKEGEANL